MRAKFTVDGVALDSAPNMNRFLDKVSDPDPVTGCRVWLGRLAATGYGALDIDGVGVPAHRVSYAMFVAPIPDDKLICHRCDARPCITPEHLFAGTQQDNMDDCKAKGRTAKDTHAGHPETRARGHAVIHSKLTADQVIAIRASLVLGHTNASLGRQYKVSDSVISNIKTRATWRHV